MDLLTFIIILHLVGTVLGVGGATFIEININKALKDGEIDPVESSFLASTFTTVRIGLIISLFTGMALLLLYRFEGQAFKLYDPTLWAKFTMLGIIVVNALLLQAHRVPLWLGSALSFVSWYGVMIAGVVLRGPSIPYVQVMFLYIVALLVGVLVLAGIRKKLGVKA